LCYNSKKKKALLKHFVLSDEQKRRARVIIETAIRLQPVRGARLENVVYLPYAHITLNELTDEQREAIITHSETVRMSTIVARYFLESKTMPLSHLYSTGDLIFLVAEICSKIHTTQNATAIPPTIPSSLDDIEVQPPHDTPACNTDHDQIDFNAEEDAARAQQNSTTPYEDVSDLDFRGLLRMPDNHKFMKKIKAFLERDCERIFNKIEQVATDAVRVAQMIPAHRVAFEQVRWFHRMLNHARLAFPVGQVRDVDECAQLLGMLDSK
jgi:hypothetical protein